MPRPPKHEYPVQIHRSKKRLTEERLTEAERALDVRLPDEYRAFLLRHNGGQPEPDSFRFGPDSYEDSCVDYFLAVYDGQHNNFEEHFKRYRDPAWPRIPSDLVPIGRDPGGSLICLGVTGQNRGKVFFWDYTKYEDTGKPTYKNVFLVADTFDDFLAKLSAEV